MKSTNRRTFLKVVATGAVAATLPAPCLRAEAEQPASDPQKAIAHASSASSLLGEVNLLQGTNSTPQFSRGNTLPIVAMPFGMAHWTPQSVDEGPWLFHPNDRRLQGIRCTHQLSP